MMLLLGNNFLFYYNNFIIKLSFDKALSLTINKCEILNNKGNSYDNLKQYEKAIGW